MYSREKKSRVKEIILFYSSRWHADTKTSFSDLLILEAKGVQANRFIANLWIAFYFCLEVVAAVAVGGEVEHVRTNSAL